MTSLPARSPADANDVLRAGGDLVLDGDPIDPAAVGAAGVTPARRPSRAAIPLTKRHDVVMRQVLEHVVQHPSVYQAHGELVHTVVDVERSKHFRLPENAPAFRTRPLSIGALRSIVAAAVDLYEQREDARKSAAPPEWLLRGLLELHEWKGARPLLGIVSTPVLRADGSLLDRPGYDAPTSLVLERGCIPRVAPAPTQADARAAAAKLLEVVRDFPFKTDAHRSVFLSGVLSILARPAIDGSVPLHYIEANVRGAGKSLLADVIALIATGRTAPRMVDAKDDDEWRKRMLAIGIAGVPLMLIDNVRGKLSSAALDAVLTAELWEDRLLNRSELAGAVAVRSLWLATGNNAEIGGDLGRRMILCRLESPHEHPEERDDVAGEDALKNDVKARRVELVGAALTMLRAWIAAGRPRARLRPFLGFQSWSDVVRQTIAYAGQADPAETIGEVRMIVDQDTMTLRDLLAGWHAVFGEDWRTLRTVIGVCYPDDGGGVPPTAHALREALDELAHVRGVAVPRANVLGRRLGQYVDRIADLRVLERKADRSLNGWEWRVRSVEPAKREHPGDGYEGRDWSDEIDPADRAGARQPEPGESR